jgi:hypothetical protein
MTLPKLDTQGTALFLAVMDRLDSVYPDEPVPATAVKRALDTAEHTTDVGRVRLWVIEELKEFDRYDAAA